MARIVFNVPSVKAKDSESTADERTRSKNDEKDDQARRHLETHIVSLLKDHCCCGTVTRLQYCGCLCDEASDKKLRLQQLR
jgi:hypothetical protein